MKTIKRLYLLPIILSGVLVCSAPFARGEEAAKPASGANANGNGITLNFRGVPLDTVLDYLSRAAGFVIVKETEVDGHVDVWSHQSLTKDEAVNLLNTILFEKGFAAIRNDRTLTIVRRDDAKQRDIPVIQGNDPQTIPKTDQMVTQIIPVRYTDAMKLIENLQPLMPTYATMSANESSNAIIIVDTQKNIRRIAEIIRALDTSISSISSVKVFPLNFADATEIAEVVEEVFQIEESSSSNQRGRFPNFGGRGGRGGFPGMPGGGDNQNSGDSEARKAASRVVAVAEERTNSVVVSAPEELMPMIQTLINDIDIVTDDITEIWVFHLKYADATEMQQIVTDLFPDDSSSNTQFAPRFGGRGGFPGGPGGMMGGGRGQPAKPKRTPTTTNQRSGRRRPAHQLAGRIRRQRNHDADQTDDRTDGLSFGQKNRTSTFTNCNTPTWKM